MMKQARISVIRQGEFVELTPDEQKTVTTIEHAEERRVAAKVKSVLTHKGRPLPEHIQKAIEKMEKI